MPLSVKRRLFPAIARGAVGRCPACGRGRLLHGYIRPYPTCGSCGADLAPYQTADFAPYLVTFAIGLVFTPTMLVLSLRFGLAPWQVGALLAAAILAALVLLPRAKGFAIGLLWALDVRA